MKKRSLKALVAAAVLGASMNTHAAYTDNVPVLLGSGCDLDLKVPEDSGGFIPSGNCKTVFVLPNVQGKVKTVSFRPTSHMLLCGAVEDYESAKAESLEIIKKLKRELGSAKTDAARDSINKRIADLERQGDAGSKFLKNKPGAVSQLVFTHDVSPQDISTWIDFNRLAYKQLDLTFTPAPISSSVLTFAMPSVDKVEEDFILSSTIPNLVKKEANGMRTVPFNGSLSGQVVFSLFGACPLIDTIPKTLPEVNKAKLSDENLSAYLVANRTFEVATRSQMSYEATLKKHEFISYFNQFAKTRTSDFKIHEFVNRDGQGSVEDFVNFRISTDHLSASQVENWNAFQSMVMNEVATRLSTRMLKHIETLGIIQLSKEAPDETPPPGIVYVDGTQTSCSSTSFAGIKISGGCRTYMVKIPRNADGQSTLIDEQKVDSDISITEKMTIEQPYSYLYTSSFAP